MPSSKFPISVHPILSWNDIIILKIINENTMQKTKRIRLNKMFFFNEIMSFLLKWIYIILIIMEINKIGINNIKINPCIVFTYFYCS